MENIKHILIVIGKTIVILLTLVGIVSLTLLIVGYRPIIDNLTYPDWIAISAIGQCVGAIAAVLVPILIFWLSNQIKNDVSKSSNDVVTTIKRATIQDFTPNEKYHEEKNEGRVTFDYSNNNGRYCIGKTVQLFEVKFSKASNTSIHIYNDPASIQTIALVKDVGEISSIDNAEKYDTSSRTRTPLTGQIVVLKNIYGFYAAIKIIEIKDDTRGDKNDEVTFEYIIQTNGTSNFSNR